MNFLLSIFRDFFMMVGSYQRVYLTQPGRGFFLSEWWHALSCARTVLLCCVLMSNGDSKRISLISSFSNTAHWTLDFPDIQFYLPIKQERHWKHLLNCWSRNSIFLEICPTKKSDERLKSWVLTFKDRLFIFPGIFFRLSLSRSLGRLGLPVKNKTTCPKPRFLMYKNSW